MDTSMIPRNEILHTLCKGCNRLYYVARLFKGEIRLRVYTVSSGAVLGLDQHLSLAELEYLQVGRTAFSSSRFEGPGGLILDGRGERFVSTFAIAVQVGKIAGIDAYPTSL